MRIPCSIEGFITAAGGFKKVTKCAGVTELAVWRENGFDAADRVT